MQKVDSTSLARAESIAHMSRATIQIDPPIFVRKRSGVTFALPTVEELIDYVRRNEAGEEWRDLRDAAFVAAALPSAENIEILRRLADEAFAADRDDWV